MKYVATSEMVIGGKIVKKGEIIENPSEFKIGLELVIDEQQQLLVEEPVAVEVVVEQEEVTEQEEPIAEEVKSTRSSRRSKKS
jgi:hypothetical protein